MTSGIQTCPLCVPHLASSDLHLLLLLSLASNPKHSHSAVHPPRPAGWKTGLNVPKPTPHCFNNTPLVNRECEPSVFFVFVSIVRLIFFFCCLRPLSNFCVSAGDKRRSLWMFLLQKRKERIYELSGS